MTQIILASSSIYRKQLLENAGFPPLRCIAPQIDETPLANETAEHQSLRLAQLKAQAIIDKSPMIQGIIIGSDQVAECDGVRLEKPENHLRATEQLQCQRGKTATFYTSVCLIDRRTPNKASTHLFCHRTSVHFFNLTDEEIEQYLIADKPYDCCGSFKSEGLGMQLIESIDCNGDPTALIGIPVHKVVKTLREIGVHLLHPGYNLL